MKLEQLKARLAAIVAELEKFEGIEALTEENVVDMNTLSEEFEAVQAKVEAIEKAEAIKAKTQTVAKKTTAPKAAARSVEVSAPKNGGFNNYGDFLLSVKKFAAGHRDQRFENTLFEKHGEDGGFLVPEEFLSDVQKKINGDDALLSKTRQFVISGNNLSYPINETQPWNGGVQAYWMSEGAQYTESGVSFGEANLKLKKLGALVKVTDELLDDAVALESYIRESAPEAMNYKINDAILFGDGVGKPHGALNSSFRVTVAKESGQTADTVVAANIVKMYSRLLPASRNRAAWYIHPEVEAQLRLLQDGAGNYIYLAPGSQLNQNPYGMLLGLPVYPMLASMKQVGDEGDIALIDLNYYHTIIKSGGMKSAISTHLYFDYDISAFKFTFRLDGKCPFTDAVQVENGSYEMSGIITLADRA